MAPRHTMNTNDKAEAKLGPMPSRCSPAFASCNVTSQESLRVLCFNCCRKESSPETWWRCSSQRTQSSSSPQRRSSENYFPKVRYLVLITHNASDGQMLQSGVARVHFRAQPTHRRSDQHARSGGEVCGVPEEECQLHTTGQFLTVGVGQTGPNVTHLNPQQGSQSSIRRPPLFPAVRGGVGADQHSVGHIHADQDGDRGRSRADLHRAAQLRL